MKDKQEFHTRLLKKIQEASNTPEFAASNTGLSKLTRTLQLLGGTSPEVLVDILGITDIPNDPWKAMNMVRNMDIATVRALEVFATKGKGKAVGHHLTPGNILGKHLLGMSPADRYDVYKGLLDMGRQHGMDPRQIIPLIDQVHFGKAHGKDYSGKKTGALLEVIKGERGVDFLKRFQTALEAQDTMNTAALADPTQQKFQAASEGAANALDVPDTNLTGVETPPAMRKTSTEILKPSADQVRTLIETNPDATPEQIRAGAEQIVRDTPLTKTQQKKLSKLQTAAGQVRLNPKAFMDDGLKLMAGFDMNAVRTAASTIKNNLTGAAVGAASLVDADAIRSAGKGDYAGAAAQTTVGAVTGSLIEEGAKRALPTAMRLLPRAGQMVLGTVAKTAGPLGLAYAGYDLLDATVEAATGKNLQETGVAAEETKDRLRSEGASEYDLRRRARTGRM
tara:strand:+ start:315 stop:1667 length:1353 start_codon:yes stop_codon:yes gene_type:complete